MSSTKQIKYRDAAGNETLMNIAVDAVNVESNTFTPATTRVNLVSGEKLPTIFGKIMRWFADLKAVAFTGSYTDLSSKPSLGTASGYAVANNDTTNNASYLSTAAVAYQHGREIDQINSDLSSRLPGGTGIQWDGVNFWGTTTAGVKKKLGEPVVCNAIGTSISGRVLTMSVTDTPASYTNFYVQLNNAAFLQTAPHTLTYSYSAGTLTITASPYGFNNAMAPNTYNANVIFF